MHIISHTIMLAESLAYSDPLTAISHGDYRVRIRKKRTRDGDVLIKS